MNLENAYFDETTKIIGLRAMRTRSYIMRYLLEREDNKISMGDYGRSYIMIRARWGCYNF